MRIWIAFTNIYIKDIALLKPIDSIRLEVDEEKLSKENFFSHPQHSFSPPNVPNLPLSLLRKRVCKVHKTGTP
jgi:hypothetical protein